MRRGGIERGEDFIYPQAPRLVRPRRARSPVAPDARSVPSPRRGSDAAADAGRPRGRVLSAVSRAVSRSGDARERQAEGGARSLGRLGLLGTRLQSPRARETGVRCRGSGARGSRGADQAAGGGAIHRGSGGELCVREAGGGGGYECLQSHSKSIPRKGRERGAGGGSLRCGKEGRGGPSGTAPRSPLPRHLETRPLAGAEERQASMGVQSGGDR